MKSTLRQHVYELTFLVILTCGIFVIAKAQNASSEKKIRLEVEITENGKSTSSIKELSFNGTEISGEIDEILKEIELSLTESMDKSDGEDFEIIIKQKGNPSDANANYQKHVSVFRNEPFQVQPFPSPHACLGVVARFDGSWC